MYVAVALSLLGLLVVLVAWYRDTGDVGYAAAGPDWGPLPPPGDVVRVEFPLTFAGYDPASVELHLDALSRAYADLYDTAPEQVRVAARQRAALRAGVEHVETVDPAAPPPTALGGPRAGSDADALRTEAALADLDFAHRDRDETADPAAGTAT